MCQTVCQTTTEFQTWEQFSPDLKVLTENWKFRYIFNIYVPIYESIDLSMYWPIWLNCLGSFRLTTKLRIRYKNVLYILCSHMVQSLPLSTSSSRAAHLLLNLHGLPPQSTLCIKAHSWLSAGLNKCVVVVELRSHIWLFMTPWTAASTPGLPVPHHLPKFFQVQVHCIGDAIQPSHLLVSSSSSALNLSQHQGLFQWVSYSHQMTKILGLQLQHQFFQWVFRIDFL